jgi:signal transduction histidine kinase
MPDDVREAYSSLNTTNPVTTLLLDDNRIGGYLLIDDIYGQPAIIVKMDIPREIYSQGQTGVWYLLVAIGVCVLVTGVVSAYFANKQGISRLKKLMVTVEEIETTGDISKRLEIDGNDELTSLSNRINGMLTALQELYDKEANLRRQLEQEMINRVEFTRALVHELKTPLTPIIASSDILLSEVKDELLHSIADNINKGAVRLNKRIDELLDVSRSETGGLVLKLSLIEPSQFIRRIVEEVTPVASQRRLSLVQDIPSVLPSIWADEDRLRQVLVNLLDNACKYTPAGETVTVRAQKGDKHLKIEVQNTGTGLTDNEMKRLFQPYYRIEKDRQRFSGLGLGLSLCKTIIELHGGEIWVNSNPGKSVTFGFTIPLEIALSENTYEDTDN